MNYKDNSIAVGDTPIVVLSTADWDAALWTNKQHIASRLAVDTPVIYINSMGLRAPSVGRKDIRRIIARMRPGRRSKNEIQRPIPELLTIITPTVIPFHKFAIVRGLNRALVSLTVRPRLPSSYVLWTFSPFTYGIDKRASGVVYHSVDLLHEIPGIDEKSFLVKESELLKCARIVIGSSKEVVTHLRGRSDKEVRLWRNVADLELFSAARKERTYAERPESVLFAGNLTPSKIDIELLAEVAGSGLTLRIAGPIGIDGAGNDDLIMKLLRAPGVTYLGVLSQEQLAQEMRGSRVGVIPYVLNEYTRGVFPMKVFEYLAGGLRVVSTALPSLSGVEIDGLDVAPREEFIEHVRRAMRGHEYPPHPETVNGWENRLEEVRAAVVEAMR